MANHWTVAIIFGVISTCAYINSCYADSVNLPIRSLRVGLISPPNSFDVLSGDLEVSVNTHQQLFLSLLDPDNAPEWSLIKSWQVSSDKLNYTIQLRPDIIWSDGTPLKAEDWIAAIHYQTNGSSNIMNKQLYSAIKRDTNNKIYAQAVDDTTIELTLIRPDPLFMKRLIISNASVLKKSQWDKLGKRAFLSQNILTISPFKIASINLPQTITLEKMPNFPHAESLYWDKIQIYFIKKLQDRMIKLQDGELDIIRIDELNAGIGNSNKLPGKLLLSKWPNTRFMIINPNKKKPLLSDKLRQALALLADPYTLNHLSSELEKPIYNIVPSNLDPEYKNRPVPIISREERFRQAKVLLDSLDISPRKPAHLIFRVLNQRSNMLPAKRFYEIAKMHGIILDIIKSDSREHYSAIFSGNYDMATLEWFPSVPSIEQQFIPFGLDSTFLKQGYHNPAYIAELEKAKQANTRIAIYQSLQKAENILMNDHYVLPLSRFFNAYMIGPKLAQGQQPTHRLWRFKPVNFE